MFFLLILQIIGNRSEESPYSLQTFNQFSGHDAIYVFEFKVDGTPEEALEQINSKGYAIPYQPDHRSVDNYRYGDR